MFENENRTSFFHLFFFRYILFTVYWLIFENYGWKYHQQRTAIVNCWNHYFATLDGSYGNSHRKWFELLKLENFGVQNFACCQQKINLCLENLKLFENLPGARRVSWKKSHMCPSSWKCVTKFWCQRNCHSWRSLRFNKTIRISHWDEWDYCQTQELQWLILSFGIIFWKWNMWRKRKSSIRGAKRQGLLFI